MADFSPDTFTDNPLVGSIANAMGLGPLFAEGGPPAAGASGPTPAASRAAMPPPPRITADKAPVPEQRPAQLRESMQVRQRYPQAKTTRGVGPGANQVGMNMPGVMSSDVLMHPAVQALLNQYGVSPEQATSAAENASPNMFITNPEAYQKHPVLSNLIERGLEGAAFTKGSNTWGEGISNVAQGMLNAQGARAEKYNNQLMMPFAQAAQVAQLQGTNLQQNYEQSEAKRANAMADYYADRPALMHELNMIKQTQAAGADAQRKAANNFKLVSSLRDVTFNPAEQAKYQSLLDDAGGDPAQIDTAKLMDLHSSALQRRWDDQFKQRQKIAGISASGRVSSQNNVDARAVHTSKVAAAKDAYDKAEAEYRDFDKNLAAGSVEIPDPDKPGSVKIVWPGDDEGIQQAQELYKKKVDDNFNQYQQVATEPVANSSSLAMPGVVPGNTSKPSGKQPKVRTFGVDFH